MVVVFVSMHGYSSILTLGIICIVLAIVISIMDILFPSATASFFNIDILASFEDVVIVKTKEDHGETSNGDSPGEMQELRPKDNANQPATEPEELYGNVEVKIIVHFCMIQPFLKCKIQPFRQINN